MGFVMRLSTRAAFGQPPPIPVMGRGLRSPKKMASLQTCGPNPRPARWRAVGIPTHPQLAYTKIWI